MDALFQRLKELEPQRFEQLCFQLTRERHPGLNLRHVEGASGDDGVDFFMGDLAAGPIIWQCKSFPNGVRKSQKQQIRESLRKAIIRFRPARWVLCLSVDLDIGSQRWFQRLQKSYSNKTNIDLLDGSRLVGELVYRHSLRDYYFPNASLNVAELKRIITRTGELTLEELDKITEQNVDDYIERLKERDARFYYEVVFSKDAAPPPLPVRPGLFFSMSQAGKTVNLFPRDREALAQDPPQFSLRIKGAGVRKYELLVRTGAPQEFLCSEVENFRSDWPFLQAVKLADDYKLTIGPSAELTKKKLRVKLTFEKSGHAIEYKFLELEPVRAGTAECEFVTRSESLPFILSMVLPLDSRRITKLNVTDHLVGRDVREIKKFILAMQIMEEGGDIQIYDLERDKQILRAHVNEYAGESWAPKLPYIEDLVIIANRFNINLILPDRVTEEDFESIGLLKTYVQSGHLPVESLKVVLVKSKNNEQTLPAALATVGTFRLEQSMHIPQPRLFGTEVNTGRCAITAEEAEVLDLENTIEDFKKARIGQDILLRIKPRAPARFELL